MFKIFTKTNIKNFIILFLLFFILQILVQSIGNPLFTFNEAIYLMQPYDLRGFAKSIIYILAYFSAIAGILLLVFIESNKLFIIFMFITLIFYFSDFFIQLIGLTNGFSHDKFTLAMNEAGNISFLISYLHEIFYSFFITILIISTFIFFRKRFSHIRYNSINSFLLIIPILSIYSATLYVSSLKSSSFPAPFKTPAIALYYFISQKDIEERILNNNIKPTLNKSSKNKNIIWIIDESITGTYLSINGYKKDTTPFLKEMLRRSKNISNYGTVNAVSNCSLQSNLFLRIGLNPMINTTYDKSVTELPTIYQYAKRAGYTTWLIDSQAAKDTLQDALSIYDLKSIDNFITYERNILPHKRDNLGLKKVIEIQENNPNDKNFIVIVKFGAHFPYLLSYDNKYTRFLPAMETTYGGFTAENKQKLINTYLNSLFVNTDLYLKNLISKIDLSKNIVFYTSDHGQNIMESNSKTTHCNTENILKNEVSVPLLVFHDDAKNLYPADKTKNYSQIQIFPTTLSLFGYEKEILTEYGETLWQGINKKEERLYYIVGTGKKGKFNE